MQRHSNQRNKNELLEQTSPRRPVSRGIFFIIANPDCNSAEKEQRPQGTAQPTPFQCGLQIIFVQEPPNARGLVDRHAVVGGKHNAKSSWPEPEKTEGPNCRPIAISNNNAINWDIRDVLASTAAMVKTKTLVHIARRTG